MTLRNHVRKGEGYGVRSMNHSLLKEWGSSMKSRELATLAVDTAPVLIWMSGTDQGCVYFNQTWLGFTGRSLDQELGNGWAEGVHPDDVEHCMGTYLQAFDQRESFRMEYRLRRHDGEYRWVLDIGTPRFSETGVFEGYSGIAVDVTDRKIAEGGTDACK
jgi:PAS domain S-box-containing protein